MLRGHRACRRAPVRARSPRSSTSRVPRAIPTRPTARVPGRVRRLGIDPVRAGPFPCPVRGRGLRAADLVLATSATGRRRLQRRGRRRCDQPARRPRRPRAPRHQRRRLRRHLARGDGHAPADHRADSRGVGGSGRRGDAARRWSRGATAPRAVAFELPAELVIRASTGPAATATNGRGERAMTDPQISARRSVPPSGVRGSCRRCRRRASSRSPISARELGVSHMTIRRDLHALEGAGRLRLVHGGASLRRVSLHRADFPGRATPRSRGASRQARRRPRRRDRHDRHRCRPTAYALARALPEDFGGCVITHSMPVLQLLAERRGATGGRARR